MWQAFYTIRSERQLMEQLLRGMDVCQLMNSLDKCALEDTAGTR